VEANAHPTDGNGSVVEVLGVDSVGTAETLVARLDMNHQQIHAQECNRCNRYTYKQASYRGAIDTRHKNASDRGLS
jgi:hypothetical protein